MPERALARAPSPLQCSKRKLHSHSGLRRLTAVPFRKDASDDEQVVSDNALLLQAQCLSRPASQAAGTTPVDLPSAPGATQAQVRHCSG